MAPASDLFGRGESIQPWWLSVIAVIGGALFLGGVKGYQGQGGDLHQYLLPSLAAHNPEFAPRDWFVRETTHYHYGFQALLSAAVKWGVLDESLIIWYGVAKLITAAAILGLVRHFQGGLSAYFVAVITIYIGIHRGWGANDVIPSSAVPHTMAFALVPMVWLAVLAKRPWFLALSLLAVIYVHVNVGVLVCVIAAILLVATWTDLDWDRSAGLAAGATLALMAPLGFRVLSDFGGEANPELYKILFFGRSPHHFAPRLYDGGVHYATTLGFLFCGVGIWLGGIQRRPLLVWLVAVGASFGSAIFFLEMVYWPPVVLLFPYRLFPHVLLLASVLLSVASMGKGRDPRQRIWATILLGGYWLAGVGEVWAYILVAATFIAFATINLRPIKICIPAIHVRFLSLFVIVVGSLIAGWKFSRVRWGGGQWPTPEDIAVAEAIRESCPRDSIILSPPTLPGLRTLSERSIVVDFKSLPFKPAELYQWRTRMLSLTGLDAIRAEAWAPGTSVELARKYDRGFRNRSIGQLRKGMKAYGADCLLIYKDGVASRALLAEGINPDWRGHGLELFHF